MSTSFKISLLLTIAAMAIVGVLCIPAFAQDLNYHSFFDQRRLYGIANFWNVASNLPFLIVGLLGFRLLYLHKQRAYLKQNRPEYLIFSLGVSLVAFGSGYYHLEPSNNSLLWDRLPMTIAFMSFFCIVIADYISSNFARKCLLPLIILGGTSVLYWHYTETIGVGDLRYYALVQFLPVTLISLIVLMFNRDTLHSKLIWATLGMYVLAKVFEAFDYQIYQFLGVISGHSIKHVAAAIGAYYLIVRAEKLARQSPLKKRPHLHGHRVI